MTAKYIPVWDRYKVTYKLVSNEGVTISFTSPEHAAEDHALMRSRADQFVRDNDALIAEVRRLRTLINLKKGSS